MQFTQGVNHNQISFNTQSLDYTIDQKKELNELTQKLV